MRESVLWTILPVGLRQLTGRLLQPNPFLFTLWIIRLLGKAALVQLKPAGTLAGGRPEYRARRVEGNWRRLANKSNLSPMLCFVFVEKGKRVQNPDRLLPVEGAGTPVMRAADWRGAEDTLLSLCMCV